LAFPMIGRDELGVGGRVGTKLRMRAERCAEKRVYVWVSFS
jgi:hypothetical protein